MKACNKMKQEGLIPAMTYGVIPGVKVGSVFKEKGELEVARLHSGIVRGISWPISMTPDCRGAYSIVMSGGYQDDEDDGDRFKFVGMGLGSANQEYRQGNLALRYNKETKTPVRVIRRVEQGKEFSFSYEGLYDIIDSWLETSTDGSGRKVIKFQLQKHKENTKSAAATVQFRPQLYNALTSNPLGRYERLDLSSESRRKRKKPDRLMALLEKEELRLGVIRQTAGLLSEDISGGKEKVRIPVFNTEDDAPLPALEYVASSRLSKEVMAVVEAAASSPQRLTLPAVEGLHTPVVPAGDAYRGRPVYLPTIFPEGIDESNAKPRRKLVSEGIQLPLEVFRTPGGAQGWGVRCSELITGGAFVCEYAGELIHDNHAETQLGDDDYFFGMDHFYHMVKNVVDKAEQDEQAGEARTLSVEELATVKARLQDLNDPPVLDAKKVGNVGRFINHSCKEENLAIQVVFTHANHSLLFYRVAFIATRDIPAYTELKYNYGYSHGDVSFEWVDT
mmetsp:Transcript_31506/g.89416  ORF Transcript_31506/g.89416 Transcript_31506/m.89416 type:complete len:505 (+) Transcript_31506:2068-3582(+)